MIKENEDFVKLHYYQSTWSADHSYNNEIEQE